MRIGMMADVYKPHVSGVTHYIDLNRRYLENAGHQVFIFTFGDPGYRDGESNVLRSRGLPLLDTGYYFSLQYSREACALLQSMDVVHVHHPFLSGQLALRYCRPLGIPIVFTNHTRYDLYAQVYLPILPGQLSDSFMRAYLPSFCAQMDLVISPTPGTTDILRRLGVTSPLEVIPHGVPLERFYRATPLPRSGLGYSASDILLIYAGRIATEKNLPFLLRAFARLARSQADARLLIIGGGFKRVESGLRELAAKLGIAGRVRFTGMLPYEDLPAFLAMGDIFVTASITETFGMTAVEAMGAGLPVVGIASPGVSDIVTDGHSGLVAANDLADYSTRIEQLCVDAQLRRRMGRDARAESERYDIGRTAAALLACYEQLHRAHQAQEPIAQ